MNAPIGLSLLLDELDECASGSALTAPAASNAGATATTPTTNLIAGLHLGRDKPRSRASAMTSLVKALSNAAAADSVPSVSASHGTTPPDARFWTTSRTRPS